MKGWITLGMMTSDGKDFCRKEVYVNVNNIANVCPNDGGKHTLITTVGGDYAYIEVLESVDKVMELIRSSYEDT